MTAEKKWFSVVFAVILVLTSTILVVWAMARSRTFDDNESLRMRNAAESAAIKISTDIMRLRRMAELFSREYADLQHRLLNDPFNNALKQQMFEKVQSFFPEQYATTIADWGGTPLYSSLTGLAGPRCKSDLTEYANDKLPSHQSHLPGMHFGPEAKRFSRHFDILVPIDDEKGDAEGIFFLSLKSSLIEATLKLHQLPEHQLYLVSTKNPLEAQTQADAGLLNEAKFPVLPDSVLADIHEASEVSGTIWSVLAIPKPDYLASARKGIWGEIFLIWAGLCLLMGTSYLYLRREADRLAESKVLNDALRSEIDIRKQTEERLRQITVYDQLTGLTNKQAIMEFLSHALAAAHKNNQQLAVIFFDLDRFKTVNESLGHGYGDMLLKEIALRLKAVIPDTDMIARWGGDEFLIVSPQVANANEAGALADRLLNEMHASYQVSGHEIITSISIGIALFPDSGTDIDTLVKNAETAMYRAKHEGRSTYRFYREEMSAQFQDRLLLENDLRHALDRGQFRLLYQPRVTLSDNHLVGSEALLHWQHPERGLLKAGEFIPLLEETGMITETGNWVLEEACRQIRRWMDNGRELSISINLTARELENPELIERVSKVLLQSSIPPRLLEIEMTEGTLMVHTEQNMAKLAALKGLGIRIAVDDFGTGYSSLAYLKRFPIDTLKIDKSFIDGLPDDENDTAITQTIIKLGMGLNLQVVAEGIETPAQRGFLVSKGCHEGQGYLFGKALSVEEFEGLTLFSPN